jgi:hypothetical protein
MDEEDEFVARQAGALAIDILDNRLHLPLNDGKINRDKIEDHIVIGLYSGKLMPITQEIVDLAVNGVQDMIDIQRNAMGEGWDENE